MPIEIDLVMDMGILGSGKDLEVFNKISESVILEEAPKLIMTYFPLLMIRFTPINPKSPINLLNQHQSHQLMRKSHF